MLKILKKFRQDNRGSVAVVSALAAFSMFLILGMALETRDAGDLRTTMQLSADAAVLAATGSKSRDKDLSMGELKKIASNYFKISLGEKSRFQITKFELKEVEKGKFDLEVEGRYKTALMKMFGVKDIKVATLSTAVLSASKSVELALVLDNTGSMSGRKLATLKKAAKDLTKVMLKDPNANAKISVVPFARHVNIGTNMRTPANRRNWLSVEDDSNRRWRQCKWRWTSGRKVNCRWKWSGYWNDGHYVRYRYKKCDRVGRRRYWGCKWRTTRKTWRGCVGSRDFPKNTTDSDYRANKVTGLMNRWCSRPILPLTKDKAKIEQSINSMFASDSTYIPAGLVWGWRVLSSQAPFSEGLTYAEVAKKKSSKVLVLMTDGENTVSTTSPGQWGYPGHFRNSKAEADRLTATLCRNIKAKNITIFTVAFEVNDPATKSMLRQCATSPSNYFNASNGAELTKAFEDIGIQLSDLRLAR